MEWRLSKAVCDDDPRAVQHYLDRNDGISGSKAIDRALVNAVQYNRERIVRVLLDDGRADPCAYQNMAIQSAAYNGYVEVLRMLVEDGRADVEANGGLPLALATERGHSDAIGVLNSRNAQ